jgi:hypothetical protein
MFRPLMHTSTISNSSAFSTPGNGGVFEGDLGSLSSWVETSETSSHHGYSQN